MKLVYKINNKFDNVEHAVEDCIRIDHLPYPHSVLLWTFKTYRVFDMSETIKDILGTSKRSKWDEDITEDKVQDTIDSLLKHGYIVKHELNIGD